MDVVRGKGQNHWCDQRAGRRRVSSAAAPSAPLYTECRGFPFVASSTKWMPPRCQAAAYIRSSLITSRHIDLATACLPSHQAIPITKAPSPQPIIIALLSPNCLTLSFPQCSSPLLDCPLRPPHHRVHFHHIAQLITKPRLPQPMWLLSSPHHWWSSPHHQGARSYSQTAQSVGNHSTHPATTLSISIIQPPPVIIIPLSLQSSTREVINPFFTVAPGVGTFSRGALMADHNENLYLQNKLLFFYAIFIRIINRCISIKSII